MRCLITSVISFYALSKQHVSNLGNKIFGWNPDRWMSQPFSSKLFIVRSENGANFRLVLQFRQTVALTCSFCSKQSRRIHWRHSVEWRSKESREISDYIKQIGGGVRVARAGDQITCRW
jgi:hypothetical protein